MRIAQVKIMIQIPCLCFSCVWNMMALLVLVTKCYRLVCLRVHPTFSLMHPTESFISFTSIDGTKQEVWPDSGEQLYEGNNLPNGKYLYKRE